VEAHPGAVEGFQFGVTDSHHLEEDPDTHKKPNQDPHNKAGSASASMPQFEPENYIILWPAGALTITLHPFNNFIQQCAA
jgi:hypothetical protein